MARQSWKSSDSLPNALLIVMISPRFVTTYSTKVRSQFRKASWGGWVLANSLALSRRVQRGPGRPGDHGIVRARGSLPAFVLPCRKRAEQPITSLRLFADRNRSGAYLNMLLLVAGMFGMFFFVTLFLQDVLGFDPLKAGLAFLPLTLALFASTRIVVRLIPRFGPKPLLVAGLMLIVAGMAMLTRISADSEYLSGILGPMVLFGAGAGLGVVSLNTVILAEVRGPEAGAASGMLQTMQQVGGALGLAILVTVFGAASQNAATASPGDAHRALAEGISSAFMVMAAFAACALLVSLLVIRVKSTRVAED